MGKVIIQKFTTDNPIEMIGYEAGVCWGGDVSDPAKNVKRGLDCLSSNHGRALEYPDVYMTIEGYSAKVIREFYTHIGGAPSRLQQSTRFVNLKNFDYITPATVLKNREATVEWRKEMAHVKKFMTMMEDVYGIPREDSSMALPICYSTQMVDKCNLRHLMDMSHQRMCSRAYWEYRQLFRDICNALSAYSDEWAYLVENYFKPKCELFGYCTEKDSCNRMVKKKG